MTQAQWLAYTKVTTQHESLLQEQEFDAQLQDRNQLIQEKADRLRHRADVKREKLGLGNQTGEELQQYMSDVVDEQVYTRNDGSKYQLDYQPAVDEFGNLTSEAVEKDYNAVNRFGGSDVRNLYMGEANDGLSNKLGLARTDVKEGFTPFVARYADKTEESPYIGGGNQYDGTPGPLGVNANEDPYVDIELPHDVATKFEYDVHRNEGQIENRVIGKGKVTQEDIKNYGGGKTEYTLKDSAPIWNMLVDNKMDGKLADGTPLPSNPYVKEKYHRDDGVLGRIGNSFQGGASTVLSAGYGLADAVSEIAGAATNGAIGGDMATSDEISEWSDSVTGYDNHYTSKAAEEITEAFTKWQNGEISTAKFIWEGGIAGLAAAPEAAMTSLAFVGTLYAPGKVLQGFTKVGKALKGVNASEKAAVLTAATAAGEIGTIAKATHATAGQAGFISASMASTSDDMDAYKKANNGEEMSLLRTTGSMSLNMVMHNIDGFVDAKIITGSGIGSEALMTAIKSASDGTKLKFAKELAAKGFGVAADTVVKEIPTEVIQAGMEAVSKQYGTHETTVDADGQVVIGKARTLGSILSDPETVNEMVVSAMMTPGSVAGMKAYGSATSGAVKGASKVAEKVKEAVVPEKDEVTKEEDRVETHTISKTGAEALATLSGLNDNEEFDKAYNNAADVDPEYISSTIGDLGKSITGIEEELEVIASKKQSPEIVGLYEQLSEQLVMAKSVKRKLEGKDKPLNNRPLKVIDADIKAEKDPERVKLLTIERAIAKEVGPVPSDKVHVGSGKIGREESKRLKFYGGTVDGEIRTGLLTWADTLANEPEGSRLRDYAVNRLLLFIGKETSKLAAFERAGRTYGTNGHKPVKFEVIDGGVRREYTYDHMTKKAMVEPMQDELKVMQMVSDTYVSTTKEVEEATESTDNEVTGEEQRSAMVYNIAAGMASSKQEAPLTKEEALFMQDEANKAEVLAEVKKIQDVTHTTNTVVEEGPVVETDEVIEEIPEEVTQPIDKLTDDQVQTKYGDTVDEYEETSKQVGTKVVHTNKGSTIETIQGEGNVMYINKVHTDFKLRNKGLSRELMEEVTSKNSDKELHLTASPDYDGTTDTNKLVKYYESVGFQVNSELTTDWNEPYMVRKATNNVKEASELDPRITDDELPELTPGMPIKQVNTDKPNEVVIAKEAEKNKVVDTKTGKLNNKIKSEKRKLREIGKEIKVATTPGGMLLNSVDKDIRKTAEEVLESNEARNSRIEKILWDKPTRKNSRVIDPQLAAAKLGDHFESNGKGTDLVNMEENIGEIESAGVADSALTAIDMVEIAIGKLAKEGKLAKTTSSMAVLDKSGTGANGEVIHGFQSMSRLMMNPVEAKKKVTGQGVIDGVKRDLKGTLVSLGYTEVDKIVARAIALGSVDWLVTKAAGTRALNRSDEDTAKLLGLGRGAILTTEQRELAQQFDGTVPNGANELGSAIWTHMGIKPKQSDSTVNRELLMGNLKAELGLLGMLAMEEAGWMGLDNKTRLPGDTGFIKGKQSIQSDLFGGSSTGKVSTYRITAGNGTTAEDMYEESNMLTGNGVINNGIEAGLKELEDTIGIDRVNTGVYLTAEETKVDRDDMRNEGITGDVGGTLTEIQKDALEVKNAEGRTLNDRFMDGVAQLTEQGDEYLEELMGANHDIDNTVHIVKRPGARGKNRAIQDEIKYLREAADKVEGNWATKLFSKWYVMTNNRFGIKSNTFNWQDKKLHRHAVETRKVVVAEDSAEELIFKLGIAQAFDIAVDKLTVKTAMNQLDKFTAELDKVLDANPDEQVLYGMVHLQKQGATGEAALALLGLVEYIEYREARKAGTEFKSGMTIETDAITSGYILKLLQMPIFDNASEEGMKKLYDELARGGILKADSKYATYGEWKEDPTNTDAYETPAAVFGEKLQKSVDDKVISIILADTILVLLGQKKSKDGKISISRSLMKDPFMVFNYGSSLKSIIANQETSVEDAIYDKLAEAHTTKERKGNMEAFQTVLDMLNEINSKESGILSRKLLQAEKNGKLLEVRIPKELVADIRGKVNEVIGVPLTETFEESYGELDTANKTINQSFAMMFKASEPLIKAAIDAKLRDKRDDGQLTAAAPLTRNEINEVMQELIDVLPIFKMAFAEKDSDFGVITKRGKGSYEHDERVNASNQAKVFTSSGDAFSADSMLYKMIESVTSGSPVITHFQDAMLQTVVLRAIESIGVHDANVLGILEAVEGTKMYNEAVIRLMREYSVTTAIMDSVNSTMNVIGKDGIRALNKRYRQDAVERQLEIALQYSKLDEKTKTWYRTDPKVQGVLKALASSNEKAVKQAKDWLQKEFGKKSFTMKNIQTVNSIYENMADLQRVSEDGRVKLLNDKIGLYVEHAALEGAGVTSEPKSYERMEPTVELEDDVKAVLNGVKSGTKKTSKPTTNKIAGLSDKSNDVLAKVKDKLKDNPKAYSDIIAELNRFKDC